MIWSYGFWYVDVDDDDDDVVVKKSSADTLSTAVSKISRKIFVDFRNLSLQYSVSYSSYAVT
jgi:hypothetical protein